MKLWIFKNGINVTEATFCIKNLLCGNMSRNFKMVPFCSLWCVVYCVIKIYIVRYTPSYRNNLFR